MDADTYKVWNQSIIDEFRANGGRGRRPLLAGEAFDVTACELDAADREAVVPKLTAVD